MKDKYKYHSKEELGAIAEKCYIPMQMEKLTPPEILQVIALMLNGYSIALREFFEKNDVEYIP